MSLVLTLALAALAPVSDARAPLDGDEPTATEGKESEPTATEKNTPGARLRGKVLVYGSRDPVAGARLLTEAGAAETDDAGRFELWLPPGRHVLRIRAPGFQDMSVDTALKERQDLEVEYRLAPDVVGNPFRTVVRQQREVAVSSTTLRDSEIRGVPGTFGDPFRVVGSLPGASQLAGFLPYVVVRGAAPGNTGYYLDGVRVPILFHVALGPSVIHPYFIDQVDFYVSGAPVRLGRYASGIIEGRTKAARRDRPFGEFDIRLTDAGGLVEVPLSYKYDPACLQERRRKRLEGKPVGKRAACRRGPARGSITVAGRYSYTAGILSLVQSTAKIRFWDFQGRFDHALGRRGQYTAFVLGSFDELGEKVSPDPFVRFEFYRLVQRVRHELPRGGTATYSLALGLDRTGLTATRTNEWLIAPRVDVRVPVGESGAEFGAGIDQEFQIFRAETNPSIKAGGALENLTQLFSDRVVSATGLYAELLWRKGKVEIRPGARADLYAQSGNSPVLPQARAVTHAFGVDPRVLLRERLSDRWTLRQNIGVYHQPPSFPIPVPGIESFGFERGLQRNIQGSAGYELNLGGKVVLSQDIYLGRLTNLQDYDLAALSGGAQIQELDDLVISATGWAYGLETMARLLPGQRAYGWAAYTLSRSTRIFEYGGRAPSSWDQRHIVNLVLGYRVSDRWGLGGRLHFHSGRPYTAPVAGESASDALLYHRNNRRLSPFFQLDLRAERTWRFRSWSLQLVIDVLNATYSSEVIACVLQGDAAGSAGNLGSIVSDAACGARGLRYILPSVGLRGVF